MGKKEYTIPLEWAVCSTINVKAESLEEALSFVRSHIDTIDLPNKSEYIDGSFHINEDMIADLRGDIEDDKVSDYIGKIGTDTYEARFYKNDLNEIIQRMLLSNDIELLEGDEAEKYNVEGSLACHFKGCESAFYFTDVVYSVRDAYCLLGTKRLASDIADVIIEQSNADREDPEWKMYFCLIDEYAESHNLMNSELKEFLDERIEDENEREDR